MSAPPSGGSANTTSATVSESKDTKAAAAKPAAQLEEDDEFEDFPIEDWSKEEEVGAGGKSATTHLWEESWDDDDTTDDFSVQLKEQLKKMESQRKS